MMVKYVLLVVVQVALVVLKCVLIKPGELFVIVHGTTELLQLFVDNWDSLLMVYNIILIALL